MCCTYIGGCAMLTLNGVTLSFGLRVVLNNISLVIEKEDKVAIVGVNGAGKSSLLRAIYGDGAIDSGKITFLPENLRVGWLPQVIADMKLPEEERVIDFLLSGRPIKDLERKMREISASLTEKKHDAVKQAELIRELGDSQAVFEYWRGYEAESDLFQIIEGSRMTDIDLNARISNLSGGQKSKVAFVRLLYSMPDVMLLDEPTNHLDAETRVWIEEYLIRYKGAVIVVSHDGSFLDRFINKVIALDDLSGKIDVYKGNYSQFLTLKSEQTMSLEHLANKQKAREKELQDFVDRLRGVSGKRKKQAQSREKALAKLRNEMVQFLSLITVSPANISVLPESVEWLCKNFAIDEFAMNLLMHIGTDLEIPYGTMAAEAMLSCHNIADRYGICDSVFDEVLKRFMLPNVAPEICGAGVK